ncbi:hypothetical protein GPECTOR_2g1018 [Gonium pectorale]|uniref:Protein kinase domain-containing protein n=1 Tax=Gonium pectorale TaxID=33097 RepID=A0A150H030_GONPE|nr:hypothetical protein GPECTOR_2g1018 [Gonium pectorale]|eukprot:KXZ55469.1 hypothetical protein GPECTOR_2g1018 [Gonium pectorale]
MPNSFIERGVEFRGGGAATVPGGASAAPLMSAQLISVAGGASLRPSATGLAVADSELAGPSSAGEENEPLSPLPCHLRASDRHLSSALLDSGRFGRPPSSVRLSLTGAAGVVGGGGEGNGGGGGGLKVQVSADSLRQHMRRVSSMAALLNSPSGALPEHSEFQWVFGLTGQAGSCMYMAPEVFMRQPYNAKCDVFSFGVLMYELWSHELLIFAYQNNAKANKLGVRSPHDYAQKVSEGFRPPRPDRFTDAQWDLVSRCWHQDPCERPGMAEVVERLREISKELGASTGGYGGYGRSNRWSALRPVGRPLGEDRVSEAKSRNGDASALGFPACGCGCVIS